MYISYAIASSRRNQEPSAREEYLSKALGSLQNLRIYEKIQPNEACFQNLQTPLGQHLTAGLRKLNAPGKVPAALFYEA